MDSRVVTFFTAAMLVWPLLLQAQNGAPSNDDYANAQILTGAYIDGSVGLTNATMEPGEPLSGLGMTQTAWYRWVTPEQGTASISVVGNGGTQVSAAAYVGDWSTFRLINFVTWSTTITLKFPVARGQVVYVQIARAGSAFLGTQSSVAFWSLSLQTLGSVVGGLHIPNPCNVASEEFAHPLVLSGENIAGISYPFWAEHAPVNPAEAGLNNVWYSWTAPHDGLTTVKAVTPWPYLQYGTTPMDKKTLGVFTGPSLPNLTTVATVSGKGPVTTQFNAVGGQTYYLSVGKQSTDAVIDAIITTLSQEPKVVAPLTIERCTRLRVVTETNRLYQVQVTTDLTSWLNYGEAVEGTGQPEWLYVPVTALKTQMFRVRESVN